MKAAPRGVMAKMILVALLAALMVACVGDSSTADGGGTDAGEAGAIDAATDASKDASSGQCVFGTSHFGDGCKFGP